MIGQLSSYWSRRSCSPASGRLFSFSGRYRSIWQRLIVLPFLSTHACLKKFLAIWYRISWGFSRKVTKSRFFFMLKVRKCCRFPSSVHLLLVGLKYFFYAFCTIIICSYYGEILFIDITLSSVSETERNNFNLTYWIIAVELTIYISGLFHLFIEISFIML